MKATVGDRMIVKGHRVGEPNQSAEVIRVADADGGPPYMVRWDSDGHEGLVFPGPDAHFEHLARKGSTRRKAK